MGNNGDPGEMHIFFLPQRKEEGWGGGLHYLGKKFSSLGRLTVSDVKHRVDSEEHAAVFSPSFL